MERAIDVPTSSVGADRACQGRLFVAKGQETMQHAKSASIHRITAPSSFKLHLLILRNISTRYRVKHMLVGDRDAPGRILRKRKSPLAVFNVTFLVPFVHKSCSRRRFTFGDANVDSTCSSLSAKHEDFDQH